MLALAATAGLKTLRDRNGADGSNGTSSKLQHGTPDYATLLPVDKNIGELGGWTRVSPPESAPVYAYVDYVGSVQLNVSQQPLPVDLRKDTADQVYQVARDFGATDKITVGDTTVYIGTSTSGPQSVIFTKRGLLILIKSTAPLTTDQWSEYVGHLR